MYGRPRLPGRVRGTRTPVTVCRTPRAANPVPVDLTLPDAAFLVIGVAALLAGVLPRLVAGRPLSLPIVFLAMGAAIGALPFLTFTADPSQHLGFLEHLTEVTVIVALMGAGLGLDRPPGWTRWANTWRLLGIAMPLTIAAVALLGSWVAGLAPAAALLLGAALAPTDPVLAGEVQVGEPASDPVDGQDLERAEDEVRFGLTSEAGLNDALAFPFVYAAVLLATEGTDVGSWIVGWFAYEFAYKITLGVLVGVGIGWLLGKLTFSSSRHTLRLAEHREGSVALAATFLAYGLTEVLQGYGFLAVFVAAVAIRGSERFHDYHRELHHFIEQVERLLTVLVLLLLGIALSDGLLSALGWREVVLAALVLLVVRPLLAGIALRGSCGSRNERAAMAFFGVRGIGSIYYVAYALGAATFAQSDLVWGIVGLVVASSVVLHGMTAGPVMEALDRRKDAVERGERSAV